MRRLKTSMGIVIAAASMAGCASWPSTPPDPAEPGPEPVPSSSVPAQLTQRRADSPGPTDEHAVSATGSQLHGSPAMLKVGRTASQEQERERERPQVVYGNRPSREESRRWMRRETLESPRVRAALGPRYALLNSGWLEDEKDGLSNDRYQLVFYNYTRNEIVTVVTRGGREPVSLESAAPEAQPAESREEVDAAIEIVRRDERYARQVAGLHGRGILTPAPGKERHLYLLFYDGPRATPARFQATVDMTHGKVVEARSLR